MGGCGGAGRKWSGKWDIKKTKQRKSVSCRRDIGSIQKSCCSQLTPEHARWLGERTWKDWDHSQIHPFLSPHVHNTWFCSLTLVYAISSRRMLVINPAVSFARQQNNLDFISLSAPDLGCLGRACRSTNNVSGPKCATMRIAQGPEVLSVRWDGCNVTTLNIRQDSSIRQLSGGSALNKSPPTNFSTKENIKQVSPFVPRIGVKQTFCLPCQRHDWFPVKQFLTPFVWKHKSTCPSTHNIAVSAALTIAGPKYFSPQSPIRVVNRATDSRYFSTRRVLHPFDNMKTLVYKDRTESYSPDVSPANVHDELVVLKKKLLNKVHFSLRFYQYYFFLSGIFISLWLLNVMF